MRVRSLLAALVLFTAVPVFAQVNGRALEVKKGDHIAVIGNTLADRMQHDGWLETFLQSRFPGHNLVYRDLGFSGDELTFRQRSAAFGTPDEWLRKEGADIVFAFFGYNESYGGKEGLDKFKQDLTAFIDQTLAAKYNTESPPRLVIFSPIAFEKLPDRNLPEGSAHNERLELYTEAMAAIAKEKGVGYVDLFHSTYDAYKSAKTPLTINGVHLSLDGNRKVAEIIDLALFATPINRPTQRIEPIRNAVLDKNKHWYNRYRTTDGYSIFGGRADLTFVDGQTNRDVMQREMQILDVMTANRDKVIWEAAQGREAKPDDSNLPEFIPVKTNKPGPLEGGKHLFLGGEEAIGKMTLAKGLKVNLVASEEMFKEFVNPVQISVDTKGRLWVACWPTYPHWKPTEPMNDKLLILEDDNGDGKADRCKTFADNLHNPTGFEFWNGGVLVAMTPEILFLKDTDGDDKADVRVPVLHGLDSADTHHAANSFTLDPGGALYFQEGTFHHTQVESPWRPTTRLANAGVFRYEPRTQNFEVYVTYGFANPHGHVFDRWGQDIVVDGTGSNPWDAALFSGRLDFPNKHNRPPQVYQQWTRPCPGIEYLSSRHFPPEMQGNLIVGNVITYHGLLQYKITPKDSSFEGTEVERFLSSSDPNFRPTDIEVAADGSLYMSDWQNPIIGHMQHNLRDPSRDREHGRVYRITYEGRELLKPAKIDGEPIEALLELLKSPEDRVRYRTRIELSERNSDQVIAAARKWIAALDQNDPEYEHHLLEGLWLHQSHNEIDSELLLRVLKSPDYRARAAATRVMCAWRGQVFDILDHLRELAADESPRVRLEAVRAASFFNEPNAIEVVLIAAEHPSDAYLDFLREETLKQIEPQFKRALESGQKIHFTSEAGARYLLKNVATAELLKLEKTRAVCQELLLRAGVQDEDRRAALAGLAKHDNKPELRIVLDTLAGFDRQRGEQDDTVLFDLVRLFSGRNADELRSVRGDLEALATTSKQPIIRQIAYVAMITADGSPEKAWAFASQKAATLRDLVSAVPLISDPSLRAALYPQVEPLLHGLPKNLSSTEPAGKGTVGRYVRIELPRKGTLTLAEVEVYSDGRNIARQGRASQKNTGSGGDAKRGIDGNRHREYGRGGQTHTEENTPDPWWEVDLTDEFPIERIDIYNRADGLQKRLEGYTLKVLDAARTVVFQKDGNKAPDLRAQIALESGSPESLLRRDAMAAVISVRGQETPSFKTLAKFIRDDVDRPAALRNIQRIPRDYWIADEAKPLVETLTAWVGTLKPEERTSAAALDAFQLAEGLTTLLPPEEARAIRKQLGELGVRVIRLTAVPHQMVYDKERLVVQAGKPVEFVIENADIMPHNFVITQPGALEEVGLLAESTGQQPDAMERHFVPRSDKVLLASPLVQARQSVKLSYTAPTEPGVYPYVCTYPGHWRRMYGMLTVVANLDDYLADEPAYLAAHPVVIKDELLKNMRTRKEWKLEDLAVGVEELDHGRSFGNGKQIFTVASCVGCHKLGGVGNTFGPDLAQLDPKWKPIDVLKELLDPSARINEKFQTMVFELESGNTVTGLVVADTPAEIKVLENPLANPNPTVLKKTDIAASKKSATSTMPKGLLDKLTKEEILDLIAYVFAKGDPKHRYFQGGGGHDHHH